MKLFYFEWRKFIFRKYIVVFFLLLSLIDVFKIVMDSYQGKIDIIFIESEENKKAYKEIYNKIKGNITEEKISFIEQEKKRLGEIYDKKLGNHIEGEKTYSGNLYDDYRILRQYIYEDFERCLKYKEYSRMLEKLAKENVVFYTEAGNMAGRKENEYIARTYNNREIEAYYRTESLKGYFSYTFSSILMVILCFLGIAPMYLMERESNMWNILETTYIGRKYCRNVKIFAVIVYVCIIVAWFRLLDYFTYWFLFDIEGIENPVWMVTGFGKSPLNCSIRYYILYDILMKISSIFVFAMSLLLLSFYMDKVVHVAVGFAVFLGVWLFMANGVDSLELWVKGLEMCSPVVLLDCSRLFKEFVHIEIGRYFIRGEILAAVSASCILLLELIALNIHIGRGVAIHKKFYWFHFFMSGG